MKISAKFKGPGLKGLDLKIKADIEKIKSGMVTLGERTTEQMKSYISSQKGKRKGSKGNLERNIDYDLNISPTRIEVGVGNIRRLSKSAPYWYVINYGAQYPGYEAYQQGIKGKHWTPPPNYGSFGGKSPDKSLKGPGVGGDRWIHRSKSSTVKTKFFIKPGPIRPVRYIDMTAAWLSQYWGSFWNKQTR